MNKIIKYVFSFFSAFIFFLAGVVFKTAFPKNDMMVLFGVLSLLPPILLALNIFLSRKYIKKIQNTKVADMQIHLLKHRQEAEKTFAVFLRKLQKLRHITGIYTCILWILAACVSFFGGMLYTYSPGILLLFLIYGVVLFFAVYSRIPKKEPVVLDGNAFVLQEKDYPCLYEIAHRAAKTLDCDKDITLLLSLDCNAMIVNDVNRYYLHIGIILLSIISQEELYCLCLHEFSHCSPKNASVFKENAHSNKLTSSGDCPPLLSFFTNFFVFFDIVYLLNHMIFQYATSVVTEGEADKDMAKYGSIPAAASLLLKLNYDIKHSWEFGVFDETSLYASENPDPNYLKNRIDLFKSKIRSNHHLWDSMIKQEILANNASHPTIKMRLESLNVENASLMEDNSSPQYHKELNMALVYAEDKILNVRKETYSKDREEYYLLPLERIAKWKEEGMPLLPQNYADIISDLKQLGQHQEAEALCDRAINELDENSSVHGYFMKGCALLHRYDPAGADLIYKAIENNPNYLSEGMQTIGSFYCMMGMEKELFEYRERAKQLAQKDIDEYSEIGVLSNKDRLSKDDMPREMLEEILAYIRSVDNNIIKKIYLVRKTITDDFFTSAFVILFDGGTGEQRDEVIHKIFRYLDSYPVKWQFSLFDYSECPGLRLDKIDGSLVFPPSDGT